MSVKIERDEIENLPDMLTNESFVLMFGSIPGESENRRLSLQCKTCQIPEEQNDTIDFRLAGYQKRQSGTNSNGGTFACTFSETHDMAVSKRIRTWYQHCRATTTNNSNGYSADYSRTAELTVFDTAGNVSATYKIYKVSPASIDAVSLDSSGSATPVDISVTFRYDYCEFGDSETL